MHVILWVFLGLVSVLWEYQYFVGNPFLDPISPVILYGVYFVLAVSLLVMYYRGKSKP